MKIGVDFYQAEIWPVRKDTIYAAITALTRGVSYVKDAKKNCPEHLAAYVDNDIREMERTLELLKNCNGL